MTRKTYRLHALVLTVVALPLAACSGPGAFSDAASFQPDCAPETSQTDRWRPGCATHRNIAAMADRSEDLYLLRPEGPRDATRRDTVISQYTQQSAAAAPSVPATTSAQAGAKGSD